MEKKSHRMELRNKNLRDRIDALKRKIQQTRQHASSVCILFDISNNKFKEEI